MDAQLGLDLPMDSIEEGSFCSGELQRSRRHQLHDVRGSLQETQCLSHLEAFAQRFRDLHLQCSDVSR